MATNTRAHYNARQDAARALLAEHGITVDQSVDTWQFGKLLMERTDIKHMDTARKHIATAMRRMRGEYTAQHGGRRTGAGAPPMDGDVETAEVQRGADVLVTYVTTDGPAANLGGAGKVTRIKRTDDTLIRIELTNGERINILVMDD